MCAGKSKHHPVLQPVCVYVCVLFFQTVIVILLAQSVIAVMAQDFVYVRRALQGLSVRSACPAICGTMAANVSRTATSPLLLAAPPQLCLSPAIFLRCLFSHRDSWAAHAQVCPAGLTNAEITQSSSYSGPAHWSVSFITWLSPSLWLHYQCNISGCPLWLKQRKSNGMAGCMLLGNSIIRTCRTPTTQQLSQYWLLDRLPVIPLASCKQDNVIQRQHF